MKKATIKTIYFLFLSSIIMIATSYKIIDDITFTNLKHGKKIAILKAIEYIAYFVLCVEINIISLYIVIYTIIYIR